MMMCNQSLMTILGTAKKEVSSRHGFGWDNSLVCMNYNTIAFFTDYR